MLPCSLISVTSCCYCYKKKLAGLSLFENIYVFNKHSVQQDVKAAKLLIISLNVLLAIKFFPFAVALTNIFNSVASHQSPSSVSTL